MGGPLGSPFHFVSGFRGVKGVGRAVGNSNSGGEVFGVAAGAWCIATVSIGATNEFDLRHDAGTGWVDGLEEEPWDCIGVRRCALLQEITFDGAAIIRFPDRSGSVRSYGCTGRVDERRFGGLKDPLWASRGLLTVVDLDAFAGDDEDGVLRGRRFRWILSRSGHGSEHCDESQRKAGMWCHRPQFTPGVLLQV
jgi:hypothetical protein